MNQHTYTYISLNYTNCIIDDVFCNIYILH